MRTAAKHWAESGAPGKFTTRLFAVRPASSAAFFLDVDGNGAATHDPDDKDPVTLPNDNDFDVVGDAETVVEVYKAFRRSNATSD